MPKSAAVDKPKGAFVCSWPKCKKIDLIEVLLLPTCHGGDADTPWSQMPCKLCRYHFCRRHVFEGDHNCTAKPGGSYATLHKAKHALSNRRIPDLSRPEHCGSRRPVNFATRWWWFQVTGASTTEQCKKLRSFQWRHRKHNRSLFRCTN